MSSPRKRSKYFHSNNEHASKYDGELYERHKSYGRHPNEHQHHNNTSKSHKHSDHQDKDLRRQSVASNNDISFRRNAKQLMVDTSNSEKKSYYKHPAILRNYFLANEEVANDIISDQIRSEHISQKTVSDQLNSTQIEKLKNCRMCSLEFASYRKEDDNICLPCKTLCNVEDDLNDKQSSSGGTLQKMVDQDDPLPSVKNTGLPMMPENLDSISEDSFPEDEPDMNFGHKIRITNHNECHVKLEQSDIVAITSNLDDIKAGALETNGTIRKTDQNSFHDIHITQSVQNTTHTNFQAPTNNQEMISGESKFITSTNFIKDCSIKSEFTDNYHETSLSENTENTLSYEDYQTKAQISKVYSKTDFSIVKEENISGTIQSPKLTIASFARSFDNQVIDNDSGPPNESINIRETMEENSIVDTEVGISNTIAISQEASNGYSNHVQVTTDLKSKSIDDDYKICEIDAKIVKKWKEIMKSQQNRIEDLKIQNRLMDEELQEIKSKNKRLQLTIEENNKNFINYDNEINNLNNKINEIYNHSKMLEQKGKKDIEFLKKDSEERRRLKNEKFLNQLKEKLEDIKTQEIKSIEKQYADLSEKLKESFESENIVMQTTIKENIAKISHLSSKNKEKDEKIDKIRKKYEQKESKLRDKDSETIKLKDEIKEKDIKIKEITTNVTKLKNQNRDKDFKLEEKEGIIKILRDQIQRLQNKKLPQKSTK